MQTIILPRKCDRAATLALYPELNDSVVDDNTLQIDASKVEQIGQAMLQVLVASAQSDGGIEFTATSSQFTDAIRLAKLETVLTDSEAA